MRTFLLLSLLASIAPPFTLLEEVERLRDEAIDELITCVQGCVARGLHVGEYDMDREPACLCSGHPNPVYEELERLERNGPEPEDGPGDDRNLSPRMHRRRPHER